MLDEDDIFGPPQFDAPADPALSAAWRRADLQGALHVITQGIVEIVGFEVAVVNAMVNDDEMRVIATAGREDAAADLVGSAYSARNLMRICDEGIVWGALRFIPAGAVPTRLMSHVWTAPELGEMTVEEHPEAWHPHDMLLVPLYDVSGVVAEQTGLPEPPEPPALLGLLSVDLPASGLRPGRAQRQHLEVFAAQAARAMAAAVAAERAVARVRVSEAARDVVRRASAHLDVDLVFSETLDAVTHGFAATHAWARSFDPTEGTSRGSLYRDSVATEGPLASGPLLHALADSARALWKEQQVLVVSDRLPSSHLLSPAHHAELMSMIAAFDVATLLITPLGAGEECVGYLALGRGHEEPDWSADEIAESLAVCHDVGRAILNARTFARERRLVEQLQRLEEYKRELVSSFSHELRTPVTSLVSHLELLELEPGDRDLTLTSLSAMRRGVARLSRLVDDLMLLSRLVDPDHVLDTGQLDLAGIAQQAVADLQEEARSRSVVMELTSVPTNLPIRGNGFELGRAITNLVSNALTYTAPGGRVAVEVAEVAQEVLISVQDNGIGIRPDDLTHLFEDFYRAKDPLVLTQTGSGLGLRIVQRIATRHGGRVAVESTHGEGSTFTIALPLT